MALWNPCLVNSFKPDQDGKHTAQVQTRGTFADLVPSFHQNQCVKKHGRPHSHMGLECQFDSLVFIFLFLNSKSVSQRQRESVRIWQHRLYVWLGFTHLSPTSAHCNIHKLKSKQGKILASQWPLWCYPENYSKPQPTGLLDRNGPAMGDLIDQDRKQ